MNSSSHLIAFSGYAGTGKTTLSKLMFSNWSGFLISTDELEKQMRFRSIKNAEEDKYPLALFLLEQLLSQKQNVIFDGNLRCQKTRIQIKNICEKMKARFSLIQCNCPENEAEKRISFRNLIHPGYYKDSASYTYTQKLFEPINEYPYLKLNTLQPTASCVQEIFQYIQN